MPDKGPRAVLCLTNWGTAEMSFNKDIQEIPKNLYKRSQRILRAIRMGASPTTGAIKRRGLKKHE